MPPARKSNTATGKPYRRGDALSQLGKPSKSTKKTAQRPSAPPVVAAPVAPLSEEEEEWGGIPDEVSEAEEGQEEGKLVRKSGKKGKKFLESQVDLLSLIHSITGEKDELQQTKLSKVKRPPPLAIAQKKEVDKVAAKKLEFESAKAIISAQTRAKKDRRISRDEAKKVKDQPLAQEENDMEDGAEPMIRKRVSFA